MAKPRTKAPGKAHREGISLIELAEMFPDEESARRWFEAAVWPNGERSCLRCGSLNVYETPTHRSMPYRCRDCKKYFSVRTGTAMESTNLPLRKWAWAIYLVVTNLKGVSSMKLHRDLNVTQKTAWFMAHRIRTAFERRGGEQLEGTVEVDEAYIGGKRKNKAPEKKKELAIAGRDGKMPLVGVKDRETKNIAIEVIKSPTQRTLIGFVEKHVKKGSTVYSDGMRSYRSIVGYEHDFVRHGVGEYVKGVVHTNGIESFWSMFKRGYHGVFHRMSPKHLQRYADEFAGRQNIRDRDTLDQMTHVVAGLVGRRLRYRELIAPTDLPAQAR